MDLNLLVTLDTLLAERSVSRAARRLNLSQPALSTRLARLRDLMGDPLLLPTPRGMVPTKVALDLQPRLHAALEAVRQAVTIDPDFDPARARGTLDIAASDYTQTTLLLPLARVLREEAPGLRIAWHGLNLATLADQMERGTIDLAINRPQTAPETLRMRLLCRERYVLIARKHHPSIAGSIDLDLFCALDHVIVSPEHGGFTGPTDTVLEALGLQRHVAISAPNFLVVPDVVAGSDMLALVPSRLVREQHHRLQVLEPPIGVPGFELAMLWHDRTTTHTVQRWVRERFLRVATSL